MPQPWFTPGATTASWFGQPNSAAAASTSPQPSSGYSPAVGSMFGQEPQQPAPAAATPGIAPQAPPQAGAPDFNPFPWLSKGLSLSNGLFGDAGKNLGGSGFNLADLGGPLGLASGLYSGSVPGTIGGGLATLGSLNNFAPGVANSLGSSLGLGGGVGSGAAGGALNGLGGGLGLYSGIKSGNVGQIASGALSAAQGGYQLANAVAPQAVQAATSALAETLGITTQALGMVSSYIPVVGMVISALTDYFAMADKHAWERGWGARGGPATALYENQQSNIPAGNQMFSDLDKSGATWQTDPMSRALAQITGSNQLYSAYNNPEGPDAPFGAADYYKHFKIDPTADTARVNQLQNNLWSNIAGAHNAGATAAQIGALPGVNPLWGDTHLGGQAVTQNMMSPGVAQSVVKNLAPVGQTGTSPGYIQAVEQGFWSPAWTNLITGGPENSMIARLNPSLYNTIGGGFDYSNPEIQRELAARAAYARQIDSDTSGGFGGVAP